MPLPELLRHVAGVDDRDATRLANSQVAAAENRSDMGRNQAEGGFFRSRSLPFTSVCYHFVVADPYERQAPAHH